MKFSHQFQLGFTANKQDPVMTSAKTLKKGILAMDETSFVFMASITYEIAKRANPPLEPVARSTVTKITLK